LIIAIAIALFFAAATSALGAFNNLRFGARRRPRETFGVIVSAVLAAWFVFAGVWLLAHR
jgi:hypothetical protein